MARLIRTLLASVVALASLGAITQQVRDQGVTDTEIRIGNLMPYSGTLEIFGQIGKAEAAYFDMINERGGINGRKIRFMSYDDLSDVSNAMDLTRILVETDNVLLMFGSFGTPENLAVRKYLNERQVPQLFVASGDQDLSEPSVYPWTMGWQPSYREEGRIYANYIQAFYPGKKIVALWENDQFGRELFKGLVQGLGDVAHNIRVDIAYDVDDQHLDGHISILKQSGAEVFVFAGVPENATKVIRAAAEHGWRPVFVVNQMASSIETVLKPAGTENATGVITAAFLKDASDPAWREDQARLAQLPRQVYESRRQGRRCRSLRLCRRRNDGPGAQAMRQRSVTRKRHEAGCGAQGLSGIRLAPRHQDQHRAVPTGGAVAVAAV
ncbi:branched-chain amino acid transport system substrate-binding protein [Bradyrhizobium sp. JR6.1]